MNHSEILGFDLGNRDVRDAYGGRRKRREECKREMADRIPEFGTVRAIPGIDRVEFFQLGDASALDNSHKVEPGVGDGAGAVGEADQGEHRAGSPHFGVIGARGFEGGEGQNNVADGAGTNEKSSG